MHFGCACANALVLTARALIRVYDAAGNVIETQEQADEFKEW
jgi:hypothetical protein